MHVTSPNPNPLLSLHTYKENCLFHLSQNLLASKKFKSFQELSWLKPEKLWDFWRTTNIEPARIKCFPETQRITSLTLTHMYYPTLILTHTFFPTLFLTHIHTKQHMFWPLIQSLRPIQGWSNGIGLKSFPALHPLSRAPLLPPPSRAPFLYSQ